MSSTKVDEMYNQSSDNTVHDTVLSHMDMAYWFERGHKIWDTAFMEGYFTGTSNMRWAIIMTLAERNMTPEEISDIFDVAIKRMWE